MRKFQKVILGSVISLSASLPALANYTQFDVKGTLDNSITIEVYDSSNTLFSGNDNSTVIPEILFGKVNTSGRAVAGQIGTGFGGIAVNTFLAFMDNGTTGSLVPSGINPGPGQTLKGGYFGIHSTGGSVRVRVDSMASASTNISVDYTTQTGTPPDLVLSKYDVSFPGPVPAFGVNTGVSILSPGSTGRKIAGAGGEVTTDPVANGLPGQLGLNIGLLAFNAAGGGSLGDGAFAGRVKFTATP